MRRWLSFALLLLAGLVSADVACAESASVQVAQAQSAGLLGPGDAVGMSNQFLSLLLGDLMVSVLLRVRETPGPTQIERRARSTAADFLRLDSTAEPAVSSGA